MAIIQIGSLISDISGSIGGVTFSRNGAGLIAKRRISGKQSTTAKQKIAAQSDIEIVNQWNAQSLYVKYVWKTFADTHTKVNRYGQTKTLSGFNWFKSINNAWFYMNGVYLTAPYTFAYPSFLPTFTVTLSTTDIIIDWSTPIDDTTTDLFIYATIPIKGTATYNRGSYRLIRLLPKDYTSSFSIVDEWETAHGLVWSDLATSGHFLINVQIFPIKKSNGITGTSVTALGEL